MGFFRETVNRILLPTEFILSKYTSTKNGHPPMYIVGAPRSGSTLLMQVMVQYYRLGYISNLSRNFYRVPILGSYLDRFFLADKKVSKFHSNYGNTTGLSEPNEAADYWYSWFVDRHDVHRSVQEITHDSLRTLGKQSRSMSAAQKLPFVHKNLYNSIRIKPLTLADPESLFVVINRDMLKIAASIYMARLKQNPDVNSGWSVPPRNFDDVSGMKLEVQAVHQVYFIYQQILNDLKKYAGNRFIIIRYEDLCHNPGATMRTLGEWVTQHGLQLKPRGIALPQLKVSSSYNIDPQILKQMQIVLHDLNKREGELFGE